MYYVVLSRLCYWSLGKVIAVTFIGERLTQRQICSLNDVILQGFLMETPSNLYTSKTNMLAYQFRQATMLVKVIRTQIIIIR